MEIGILYICTGKYNVFWEQFYESCQKYLLVNETKRYYIFTDDKNIKLFANVTFIYKECLGFPLDSLLRFETFLSVEEELKKMDFLLFFNSNMRFVQEVGKEILPKNDCGLVGVLHPGYENKPINQFPYERSKKSKAFLKFNKNQKYHYFMGGVNGGKSDSFIKLCHELAQNIRHDMEKGVEAIYHDESHLNHYFHNKDILILDSSYGAIETKIYKKKPKIIILNKIIHAGKYFDKLPQKNYFMRLRKGLFRNYHSLIWKLR